MRKLPWEKGERTWRVQDEENALDCSAKATRSLKEIETPRIIQKYPQSDSPCIPIGMPSETGLVNTNVSAQCRKHNHQKEYSGKD